MDTVQHEVGKRLVLGPVILMTLIEVDQRCTKGVKE